MSDYRDCDASLSVNGSYMANMRVGLSTEELEEIMNKAISEIKEKSDWVEHR